MKSTKKEGKAPVKDPIKDKYNKKLTFFQKLRAKYLQTKKAVKDLKRYSKEAKYCLIMCGEVIMYGLLGGLGLTLFGFSFGIMTVLAAGSILWLIEKKIVGVLTSVLGSISLVKIYN